MAAHKGRTIVIGDIHGQIRALRTLLKRVAPTGRDHLIFLGDYIDRGEDSKAVLDCVMSLHASLKVTALLGNHEDMLLQVADLGYQADPMDWRANGGYTTIRDFGEKPIPEKYVEWLRARPLIAEDEYAFYVHAGLAPNVSPYESSRDCLLWSRDEFLTSDYHWGKTVVTGHNSQRSGIPLVKANIICIDTGAFLEGKPLTALVYPDCRFVFHDRPGKTFDEAIIMRGLHDSITKAARNISYRATLEYDKDVWRKSMSEGLQPATL